MPFTSISNLVPSEAPQRPPRAPESENKDHWLYILTFLSGPSKAAQLMAPVT